MVIVVACVVLFTSCLATRLLRRARQARSPISTERAGLPTSSSALLLRVRQARTAALANPIPACVPPQGAAVSSTSIQDGLTWTALDDLQLTRLLTDSAPRANTG